MSHRRPENVSAGEEASRATGTAEWAPTTLNVAMGCSHGCLYCYGRANALRRGQVADAEEWLAERVNEKRVAKGYAGGRGTIMLPSTHDITPATVEAVGAVAVKLLEAKTPPGREPTRLLLVTKGDGPCIERLARRLHEHAPSVGCWRDRVLWRITIGCLDERTRQFWEPHAPPIDMRLEALRWLHGCGWQTSVSCEPLLEPWDALELVAAVAGHVTETIWIGKARELDGRTAWCRKRMGEALAMAIEHLQDWQTPSAVLSIAEGLRGRLAAETWAKVRFKDSYAEDLRDCGWQIEAGVVLKVPGETP